MTLTETARLLSILQLADNRTVDQNTIQLWYELLADLPLDETTDALRSHLRNSTTWTQPGHIRDQVMLTRSRRRPLSEQAWEARERLRAARADAIAASPDQLALPVGEDDPAGVRLAPGEPPPRDEFGPTSPPNVYRLSPAEALRLTLEYGRACNARAKVTYRARLAAHTPPVPPNAGAREPQPESAKEVSR